MEEHQHKYHEPQTPHFFKIILNDTLQSGKLSFPKSFVRKYGRNLCLNKVYLKVTSGDIWEVELNKEEDGSMLLNNGWQEFVEFYNIKFGHFLVFGYQGNSEFHVLIFDKTTSEIKHPCQSKNNNAAHVDPCMLSVKPEIEESDAEMAVDQAACQINASNSMFSNNPDKNRNYSGKKSGDDNYVNGELETPKSFRQCKSREKSEAVLRARAFDSPNPHFRIVMRKSYVNSAFTLWLPGRFITDNIGQKGFYLKLSLPCGRFWTMKCLFRMRGNLPVARIQSGWKPFVKDNSLVVGDVCVFELIDSVEVHFRVTIFRAAVDRSFNPYPVMSKTRECTDKQIMLKPFRHEESSSGIQFAAASSGSSKYPSFDLVITEACLNCSNVPIKTGFLKHLKRRTQMVTLEVAGRLWHVRACFIRQFREAVFTYGWSKFARENLLQVGDVCLFELINKEEVVLKVSIHKGSAPGCRGRGV